MKTTIIHKGKERTWEGPYENWQRHKEYIMGWCDGREVLIDGDEYDYIAFDCGKDIYSFKPEKAEPVVFEAMNLVCLKHGISPGRLGVRSGAELASESHKVSIETYGKELNLSGSKRYKITIEEV